MPTQKLLLFFHTHYVLGPSLFSFFQFNDVKKNSIFLPKKPRIFFVEFKWEKKFPKVSQFFVSKNIYI